MKSFCRRRLIWNMTRTRILFTSIFFLFFFNNSYGASLSSDRDVLELLYDQCDGSNWHHRNNWRDDSKSICEWEGIICISDEDESEIEHVRSINLSDNNLKGNVPIVELLQMEYLNVLKLDGNALRYPNMNDDVETFGMDSNEMVSSVQLLDLSRTNIYDLESVFHTIQMTELSDLYLQDNNLQGPFPETLFKFIGSLSRLKLQSNHLSGVLPENIADFFRLTALNLNDNRMTGTIPQSFGDLYQLKYLLLRGNQLSGTLPVQLLNLKVLKQLDLSKNKLTGLLPSFSTMEILTKLDLSGNKIKGDIPVDFLHSVDKENFEIANLDSNEISGSLPLEPFLNLPEGSILVRDNAITGVHPSLCMNEGGGDLGCDVILCPPYTFNEFGRYEDGTPCRECEIAKYYGEIECPYNAIDTDDLMDTDDAPIDDNFSPSITTTPADDLFNDNFVDDSLDKGNIKEQSNEQEILELLFDQCGGETWKYKENWKSGSFCAWSGITCTPEQDSVKYVMLNGADMIGTVPTVLYNLPNLESLSLSDNSIVFSFEGIVNSKKLKTLDLRNTGLNSLQFLDTSVSLLDVDLSDNKLEGSMPTEIYQLSFIEELKLDGNKMTGTISEKIENLSSLKTLSISNNNLSGVLPNGFMNLQKLQSLSLDSNNLSGEVGLILNGMLSIEHADLSHQRSENSLGGFTGAVPALEQLKNLRRLDLSQNSLTGTLPNNFLSGVDRVLFDFADLSSNSISGSLPESVKDLKDLYLEDNMINSIPDSMCAGSSLLDKYGCDAILCPPGTFNLLGRQPSGDVPCEACLKSRYYGSTMCPPRDDFKTSNESNSSSSNLSERDILEKFYKSCNGYEWNKKENWMDAESEICDWYGIECNLNGEVESIILRSNGVGGSFPTEIFLLPSLSVLNLEMNPIEFDFHGIQNAKELTSIDLSHTNTGSLLGLEWASNLQRLYLTATNLDGNIPPQIFELKSLEHLSLEFNDLSGSLPAAIGNLINLEYLSIYDNAITGSIPAEFGKLENLQFFLARNNEFSGALPTELNNLKKLWFLDIAEQRSSSNEGISGQLPSFHDFSDLRRVDLSSNSLTGTIPDNFLENVNPTMFEYVDLSKNFFYGIVPGVFAVLPVDAILLSDNMFSGLSPTLCSPEPVSEGSIYFCDEILCPPLTYNNEYGKQQGKDNPCKPCPISESGFGATSCDNEEIDQVTGSPTFVQEASDSGDLSERDILEQLYFACGGPTWERQDNWMDNSVSICKWFGIRCVETDGGDTVQYILLSSNNLVGIPPPVLFELNYLDTLVLDNNPILFDFTNIGKVKRLSTLDLSSTGIESIEGIGQAQGLRDLRVTNNDFKGVIPNELFKMTNLEQLSLDFNNFSGSLPTEIGKLTNLRLLSCASNKLTGKLPTTLGNLENLVNLHLQMNAFTGQIPDEIGLLSNLGYLDLSHQIQITPKFSPGFSGTLPQFVSLTSIKRIDLSFNSISGEIPGSFLKDTNAAVIDVVNLNDNKLTGKVPGELADFSQVNLQNNHITEIDEVLCKSEFKCDGFLCAPKTYNSGGRQTSVKNICEKCESVEYFGSTKCDDVIGTDSHENKNTFSPTSSPEKTFRPPRPKTPTPQVIPTPTIIENQRPIPSEVSLTRKPTARPTEVEKFPPGYDMTEREILELFYHKCGGVRWLYNENWLNDQVSICSWEGITCTSNGEVESIELGANNLKGTPPVELYQLKSLKSLSLYSNPLDTFRFDYIKDAFSLRELILDATGIESIKGIERAPSLTTVKLRFNNIRGNIGDITDLKTLEYLSCSNNHLTGTVPSDFDNLHNLKALLLRGNHLEGDLRGVRFPGSLKILDLSDNDLIGSIPSNFLTESSNSADLVVDLSSNSMTGTIPSSMGRFQKLTILLSDNMISGIAGNLCTKTGWNNGDVGKFGCKAILCPKGKYALNGRETGFEKCMPCKVAHHMGATTCNHDARSGSFNASMFASTIGILAVLLLCLLGCFLKLR